MGKNSKSTKQVVNHPIHPVPDIDRLPPDDNQPKHRRKNQVRLQLKDYLQSSEAQILKMMQAKSGTKAGKPDLSSQVMHSVPETEMPKADWEFATFPMVEESSPKKTAFDKAQKLVDYYNALTPQLAKEVGETEQVMASVEKTQREIDETEVSKRLTTPVENTKIESDLTETWKGVETQQHFIEKFLSFKSRYEDDQQGLKALKDSLVNVSTAEIVKWVTNGDIKLDTLFKDKSQYPADDEYKKAVLIAVLEIYCKERAKGSHIKSWTGTLLNFFVSAIYMNNADESKIVFTGEFKIKSAAALQLWLMGPGKLADLREVFKNPQSKLSPFSGALLENKSDLKMFAEQALQFSTPDVELNSTVRKTMV